MKYAVVLALLSVATCQHLRVETTSSSSTWLRYVIGPLMFVLAFPIIWYNQRRSAVNYRTLQDVKNSCEEVSPTSQVPPNKLIFVTGQSRTDDVLIDSISSAQVRNAIKLVTTVQVKEWRRMGGRENAPIGLAWVDSNVPEVGDKVNSPHNWHVSSDVIYANDVYLGHFRLSQSQMEQCERSSVVQLTQQHANKIKAKTPSLAGTNSSISDNYLYFSNGLDYEEEGALRMTLSYCPTGPLSVICQAGQSGRTFEEYRLPGREAETEAWCASSNFMRKCFQPMKSVDLVREANTTKDQLVEWAVENNRLYTFLMRVLAFVMLVLGIVMFLSPISNILGYLPSVGGFLRGTSSLIFLVGAILISIPLYTITLSLAWLVFNFRIGIIVLVAGVIILVGLVMYNNWAMRHIAVSALPPQYTNFHRPYVGNFGY